MNNLKLSCLTLCALSLMIFGVASSALAVNCSDAEILKVGTNASAGGGSASNNVIAFKCLNNAAFPAYVSAIPLADIGDQALATALTALSLDKHVWIRTTSADALTVLQIIYLNK